MFILEWDMFRAPVRADVELRLMEERHAATIFKLVDQDRAYVHALRDAHVLSDPRVGPSAKDGWDWVAGVHARQLQRLARRSERDGTPG